MRPAKRRFASDSVSGPGLVLEIEIRQAALGNDELRAAINHLLNLPSLFNCAEFKAGLRALAAARFRRPYKFRKRLQNPPHSPPASFVVRRHMQNPPRPNPRGQRRRKLRVHQSALPMTALRPRIRKENPRLAQRPRPDHPRRIAPRVRANHADIPQIPRRQSRRQSPDPRRINLKRNVIQIRTHRRPFRRRLAVPEPKLRNQPRLPPKNPRPIHNLLPRRKLIPRQKLPQPPLLQNRRPPLSRRIPNLIRPRPPQAKAPRAHAPTFPPSGEDAAAA